MNKAHLMQPLDVALDDVVQVPVLHAFLIQVCNSSVALLHSDIKIRMEPFVIQGRDG